MININENLSTLKQKFNPGSGAKVVEALQSAGYETVFVGGCIRDCILGREPHDYDITTAATVREIEKVLLDVSEVRNMILLSPLYGTVAVVMMDGSRYEVTPFRAGRIYTNAQSRWLEPEQTNLAEDLKHRDFTINAMVLRWPECELVDLYGGLEDLEAKVITCVGNPEDRFLEDPIRIIRAVRLYYELDFICVEDKTDKAISKMAYKLKDVAAERIFAELQKILVTQYPNGILSFPEVAFAVIPELQDMCDFKQNSPYHRFTAMGHTSAALDALPGVLVKLQPKGDFDRLVVALALLLHDVGKPHAYQIEDIGGEIRYHFKQHDLVGAEMADNIMRRLKVPVRLSDSVIELISHHGICTKMSERSIKSLCSKLGVQQVRQLLYHSLCDTLGRGQYTLDYDADVSDAMESIRLFEEIVSQPQPFMEKDLAISGYDLLKLGISPGPVFGEILSSLKNKVLVGEIPNEHEDLISVVKEMLDYKDAEYEGDKSFSETHEI